MTRHWNFLGYQGMEPRQMNAQGDGAGSRVSQAETKRGKPGAQSVDTSELIHPSNKKYSEALEKRQSLAQKSGCFVNPRACARNREQLIFLG